MKYSDIDVLNFIEGKFSDAQVADILAQKSIDPELANTIDLMQASLLPYQEAYNQQSLPDIPENIYSNLKNSTATQAADEPKASHSKKTAAFPYKWAACFLLAGIGLGFITASQILPLLGSSDKQAIAKQNSEHEQQHLQWVERIADYQSLYVENTVKVISANAYTDASKLLDHLIMQHAFTAGIPDLTEFGYEFARAQELGFEGGVLLQLVYSKPGSMPLAYCLMPSSYKINLPLQITQQHQLGVASWVSGDLHNVLVADELPSTLQKIHDSILAI